MASPVMLLECSLVSPTASFPREGWTDTPHGLSGVLRQVVLDRKLRSRWSVRWWSVPACLLSWNKVTAKPGLIQWSFLPSKDQSSFPFSSPSVALALPSLSPPSLSPPSLSPLHLARLSVWPALSRAAVARCLAVAPRSVSRRTVCHRWVCRAASSLAPAILSPFLPSRHDASSYTPAAQ